MRKAFFTAAILFSFAAEAMVNVTPVQEAAVAGNTDAQFRMCGFYYTGEGVPKNEAEAAKWCETAAKLGHVEAMYNLALMYQKGEGVGQNIPLAAEWYNEAAKHGHRDAQYNLSQIAIANSKFAKPKPVPKDQPGQPPQKHHTNTPPIPVPAPVPAPIVQAAPPPVVREHNFSREELKRQACLEAESKGIIAENCKVKTHTVTEAPQMQEIYNRIKQAELDANAGSANAQNEMAGLYRTGNGVPQNMYRALELYEKSARQGNVDAMKNLGAIYKSGEGVAPNLERSYAWYSLAADRLPAGAAKNEALLNVKEISAKLNNEQIGRALANATQLDKTISAKK